MIVCLILWVQFDPRKYLILNTTDSLPHGLYRVDHTAPIRVGDVVAFSIPTSVRALVVERGWLTGDAFLMKPVVGLEGAAFCRHQNRFLVNGWDYGEVKLHDHVGRKLPAVQGCNVVNNDEIVVAMSGIKSSFDSRYFGPVSIESVEGKVEPLWIF